MPNTNSLSFSPKNLTDKEIYKLLIGSIVPRPIAWLSSKDEAGNVNLAPFSFFTVASRKPPTLLVSIGPGVNESTDLVKDTLFNIRDTKEYVINIVPEKLGSKMHDSSQSVAPEVDEFDLIGLTKESSILVDTPSVKESPIAFECKLSQIIPVGSDHLVLGEVVHIRMNEEIYLGDYKTDIDYWKPLGRLAGDYAGLTASYSLSKNKK